MGVAAAAHRLVLQLQQQSDKLCKWWTVALVAVVGMAMDADSRVKVSVVRITCLPCLSD